MALKEKIEEVESEINTFVEDVKAQVNSLKEEVDAAADGLNSEFEPLTADITDAKTSVEDVFSTLESGMDEFDV